MTTSASASQADASLPTTEEIPHPTYVTLMLARDPAVQAELNLSDAQRDAVRAAVLKVDQPLWHLRDVPPSNCGEQLAAHLKSLRDALQSALKPAQLQRLDQLVIQARGAKALTAADVRTQLQLTSAQVDRIAAVMSDSAAGEFDSQKILEQLTAAQKSRLAELYGRRFDLQQVTRVGCIAPEVQSVEDWINSTPLTMSNLRGKVVVVHFWAFNCINCVRNLPHYQAWYESFPKTDLIIIGMHTPETSDERDFANLRANVRQRGIEYPVAFDAKAANWRAWANHLWPSVYLIDRRGQVRYWWYGELNWEGAEGEKTMRRQIEKLLAEQ